MSLALDDCARELDPMLPVFQVDRGVLYRIYTTMRKLKEPWLTQRSSERRVVETEPDELDAASRQMLRDEDARLTSIVEHLKRLVAAAP